MMPIIIEIITFVFFGHSIKKSRNLICQETAQQTGIKEWPDSKKMWSNLCIVLKHGFPMFSRFFLNQLRGEEVSELFPGSEG